MAFPTVPTEGAGRVVLGTQADTTSTRTFPNLDLLTKNPGDLLVAICVIYDGNSTNAEFSSWGGGFSEFADQATASTMGIGCAYKWATGSETGTFTVVTTAPQTGHAAFILLSIPGAHASTPPTASVIANNTSAAADPVALDPTGWAAEDTLWIAVAGAGETGTTGTFTAPSAGPTNYTDLAVTGISSDVVGGVAAAVAFRQLNAASENPGPFTVDTSNARNSALLIAVRPTNVVNVTGTAASTAAAATQSASGIETISGAAASTAAPATQSAENVMSFPWTGGEESRLARKVFSVDSTNMSALDHIDTDRNVAVFTNPDGDAPSMSGGQRDLWIVPDSHNIRHARVPWWGSPEWGSADIGTISPQHGMGFRYIETGGRRRAVIIWQNIFVEVYWSVLAGVWASDISGSTNFINRQIGLQMGDLVKTSTVVSSARSGGVVTLTLDTPADNDFAVGSYAKVDVATASFDGWHLITDVSGTTITYDQAGANEPGGAGTINNILPYEVEARFPEPNGTIVEVRAKRSAALTWPDWVPYDDDAAAVLTGAAGTFLSMPDAPAFDITGAVTLICDATMADWTPALHTSLVSKFTTSNPSNQRSYRMRIQGGTGAGKVDFSWSTAGTSGLTLSTTDPLPAQADNTRRAIAATLIPNDGTGNKRLKVYTAPTHKGPWTLEEDLPQAGTTSIFAGSAPLEIGSVNNGALEPLPAGVHYAAIIDGTLETGTVKAEFVAANAQDGVTTWNDPTASNVTGTTKDWTYNGAAVNENTGYVAGNEAFAVDLDMAGRHDLRTADPTPTNDADPFGYVVAHLGSTTTRSQVSFGPTKGANFLGELDDVPVISGTAASTAAVPTQEATGTETISGTATSTASTPSQAAAGTETILGATASAAPLPTQAASGIETISGTAAGTAAAGTQVAAGTVTSEGVSGTIASTAPSPTQAAAGTEAIPGSAASVAAAPTQAATGTVVVNVTGTAASAASAPTQAASGVETISGSAASVAPATTQAASGTERFTGTAAAVATAATQAATGFTGPDIGTTGDGIDVTIVDQVTAVELTDPTQDVSVAEVTNGHFIIAESDGAFEVADTLLSATVTDPETLATIFEQSGMIEIEDTDASITVQETQ